MAYGTVNVGPRKRADSRYVSAERVGVPEGIATLDADGTLTKSQIPDMNTYTQDQTDALVAQAVAAHDADASSHPDIRTSVADVETAVQYFELRFVTGITENKFKVDFSDLSDVTATGVWNTPLKRIEF